MRLAPRSLFRHRLSLSPPTATGLGEGSRNQRPRRRGAQVGRRQN